MADFDLETLQAELSRRETQPWSLPRADQVNPNLRSRFEEMAQDYYEKTGVPLRVTDSWRSHEEQKDLYRRKPNLAAKPGRSRHEIEDGAEALDIDQSQVPTLEKLGLIEKHGFVRPVLSRGETWHLELPRFEKAGKIAAGNQDYSLEDLQAELTRREGGQAQEPSLSDLQTELKRREPQGTDPITGKTWKQLEDEFQPVPLGKPDPTDATSETIAQFAGPAGEMVGEAMDLPMKPVRMALEKFYDTVLEPQREKTQKEFAETPEEVKRSAPEAFAGLPDKKAFVETMTQAMVPVVYGVIGKGSQILARVGKESFYKHAPDIFFKPGKGGLPAPLDSEEITQKLMAMNGPERADMARKYPQFKEVLDEMTSLVSKKQSPYSPEFAAKAPPTGEQLPFPPGVGETFEMRPSSTETIRRPGAKPWETGQYPEVWINEKGRVEMSPETFQKRMEAAQGFAMRPGEPTGNLPATVPGGERGLVPTEKPASEAPPAPQVAPVSETKPTPQVEAGKGVEEPLGDVSLRPEQVEEARKEGTLADYIHPQGKATALEFLGREKSLYSKLEKGESVPIFRASVDENEITPGKYVTLSESYAKDHIQNIPAWDRDKAQIIKGTALADELLPAGGPNEFYYAPKNSAPAKGKELTPEIAQARDALAKEKGVAPEELTYKGEQELGKGKVGHQFDYTYPDGKATTWTAKPEVPTESTRSAPVVGSKEIQKPTFEMTKAEAIKHYRQYSFIQDDNAATVAWDHDIGTALAEGKRVPENIVKEYLKEGGNLQGREKDYPGLAKKYQQYSPAVLQGMKDWLENKAYPDGNRNWRFKETRKITPWNKEVKTIFKNYSELTDAAEKIFPEIVEYGKERTKGEYGFLAKGQPFDTPAPKPAKPKPSLLGDETGAVKGKTIPESEKGAVGFDLNNIKEKSRIAQDPDARKVEEVYEKAEVELKELKSANMKRIWERIKRLTTDTSSNIKRELIDKAGAQGKEAVMRHDLSRGASAKAQAIIEDGFDRVYKDLSPVDETILNRALRANRDLTILGYKPEHRVTGGLTPAELQRYLDSVPPKIKERVKEYSKIMDENLTAMEEAGLINAKQAQVLREKGDYLKTNYIQHIDPDRTSFDNRGRKITVPDSGIKKIDTGSEQAAEMNSRLLMAEVIGRTQGRIFINKANEALHQYVKDNPDNPFGFKEAKIYKKTKGKIKAEEEMAWEDVPADYDMTEVKPEQKVSYRWEIPTGHTEVSVMRDGKRIRMIMPDKYAREWVQADPMISSTLANVIGWMSGTKILKAFATGMNPGFALTNLPRDIAHIWLVTGEYSKFAPKFLGQMGADLKAVVKDAVTRKGRYRDYIDEGGGMSFLTQQGQLKLGGSGPLNTLQKWAGWIGETSEIWTRLAVRERAIKNGASPEEATWIARNYLDFAQGGSLTKAADTAIPYLSASVQGTRKIVEAARTNPKDFMWKVGQIGALATGLYIANTSFNKEAYDSVPEKEKVTNWIITTPFDYRDKDGNKRYLYFRIAKDQGQRVFASLFEGLMGLSMGHKVDGDQIGSAIADFLPIVPTEKLPPAFMAMLGYSANKDFWRNRDVWQGSKVEAAKEFNKWTHPALKEAGKYTGLSPERLGYALSNFIPPTNTYAALVGGGLRKMMEDLPEKDREKAWQEILQNAPMMNKLFRSTNPYEKYRKPIEKAKVEENTRRYEQRVKVERIVDEMEGKPRPEKFRAQMDYVKTVPPEDQKRIMREFKDMASYQGIADRRWWLNLKHMPAETRAVVFNERHKEASQEERMALEKQGRKLPGIYSKAFNRKLFHLRRQNQLSE